MIVEVKVKGVSHRQSLVQNLPEHTRLALRAEPDNPFDADAVAVYYGEEKVGYLPRGWKHQPFAATVQAIIRDGKLVNARTVWHPELEDTMVGIRLMLEV